ncbi:MAG: very short patch repair endonuclease [Xylophilus ampelinus]
MTDTLTKAARSALMARVRQKDTTPEVRLRKKLHADGLRYILHPKTLPGRPDIVFPKYKTAVFVHGCFWHGHECRAGRPSSSNLNYWVEKISANRLRDARKLQELEAAGWRVATVWECETKGDRLDSTAKALSELIRRGAWLSEKIGS